MTRPLESIAQKEPVGAITLGDSVRVDNVGEKKLTWAWNNRPYIIPPGGTQIVPFDLMKKECGDPRSGTTAFPLKSEYNGMMLVPSREDEVKRLMQLHTATNVVFREFLPGDEDFLTDGKITDRCPDVEVYTLDGTRIHTVLDDPFGNHIVDAHMVRNDDDFMRATMTNQSAEMARQSKLIEVMAKKLGINPADLFPDEPLPPGDPAPTAPMNSTVKENPQMVFNPRTKKVTESRTPESDPTTLDGLPEDE